MTTHLHGRKLTRAEFDDLIHQGVLTKDDRVELIEGEVVEMPAMGGHHAGCVRRTCKLLMFGLRGRATISCQCPVALSDLTEPQPDIAVLRFREDDYFFSDGDHPAPADILALVEVADSSLAFDRGRKAPLYAAAGVPELWITNLRNDLLEVYRDPGPRGYASVAMLRRGDRVALAAFPDVVFDVADLLGPAPPRP